MSTAGDGRRDGRLIAYELMTKEQAREFEYEMETDLSTSTAASATSVSTYPRAGDGIAGDPATCAAIFAVPPVELLLVPLTS